MFEYKLDDDLGNLTRDISQDWEQKNATESFANFSNPFHIN